MQAASPPAWSRQVTARRRLDPTNFRKIEVQGVVEPVAGQRRVGAHRPAQLYRRRGPQLQEFTRTV